MEIVGITVATVGLAVLPSLEVVGRLQPAIEFLDKMRAGALTSSPPTDPT